jgi:hypothetical protein
LAWLGLAWLGLAWLGLEFQMESCQAIKRLKGKKNKYVIDMMGKK